MANTLNKTNPTTVIGDMKLREYEMDISNYDDDAAGDGEEFSPNDANMRRFAVSPIVRDVSASGVVAQYDSATGAIRLFRQEDDSGSADASADANLALTEAAGNANVSATVRITCIGI